MAHTTTHKQPACTNCAYAFVPDEPDEFCPRCGQQNHPAVIGFGHMVEEFLEGVFHFDGKVFRTAGLLLFKPGELTRRYLAGQRMPYVPPLRLYVFLSFVFFLLLSIDTSHKTAKTNFNVTKTGNLSINVGGNDSADAEGPGVKSRADSLKASRLWAQPDTVQFLKFGEQGSLKMSMADLERLPAEITDAQVDSIITSQKAPNTFLQRLVIKRVVRWHGASKEEIVHQVLRGLSILLFLLMPLAALLLKLTYFRQHRYYISHLIFTVHLQCFLLVLMALLLGLSWLHAPGSIGTILQIYGAAYFVLALKRVYAQGWLKTLAKTVLLAFAYSLTVVFALVLVMSVGAFIF